MDIHNLDCFDYFKKVKDNSVNLFVLDLPYTTQNWGKTTACAWDEAIDLEKMWIELKRTMKKNAIIIFFCNTKFGYNLIRSNEKWFKYDLIWKKSRKVGFLSANKMPLRQHENIYVFKKEGGAYNPQMEEGEPFDYNPNSKYEDKNYLAEGYYKNKKIKFKPVVNKGTRHPTSVLELQEDHENIYVFKKEQGAYNPQLEEGEPFKTTRGKGGYYGNLNENYLKQIQINNGTRHPSSVLELSEDHENIYVFKKEQGAYNPQMEEGEPYNSVRNHDGKKEWNSVYNLNTKGQINTGTRHPSSVLELSEDHENIYVFKKEGNGTYNPQMEEGEPYKIEGKGNKIFTTQGLKERSTIDNKGTRHPTSVLENTILQFNNPPKSIHKTQKPLDLLEWIIKSYSNEDDLVCDFTFGSGSVAVACMNTKRRFTGCERDKDIFKVAKDRIENHNVEEYKKKEEINKQKEIKKKIKEYKKFIEKHTEKSV